MDVLYCTELKTMTRSASSYVTLRYVALLYQRELTSHSNNNGTDLEGMLHETRQFAETLDWSLTLADVEIVRLPTSRRAGHDPRYQCKTIGHLIEKAHKRFLLSAAHR
jgi:hypothetical protein